MAADRDSGGSTTSIMAWSYALIYLESASGVADHHLQGLCRVVDRKSKRSGKRSSSNSWLTSAASASALRSAIRTASANTPTATADAEKVELFFGQHPSGRELLVRHPDLDRTTGVGNDLQHRRHCAGGAGCVEDDRGSTAAGPLTRGCHTLAPPLPTGLPQQSFCPV